MEFIKKNNSENTVLVPHEELQAKFAELIKDRGFDSHDTELLATIFMQNSLDGVYSHGVNRFPKFIEFVDKGYINLNGQLRKEAGAASLEQWDGDLRAGILNALDCTERAMELASTNGMGCVALANTNHWMRGGTYGWKAAKAGYLFIGWTNTLANMPAWGAANSKLGNNPLVMALPYNEEAIVLDMAMSQFSYGALEKYDLNGVSLPVAGGFDKEGRMTSQASDILESRRTMPAGYWKGAGLSLLLDIFSTLLAGGLSTAEISKKEAEYGVSQIFIAIDIKKLPHFPVINQTVKSIIEDYKTSFPANEKNEIVYPGENVVKKRKRNLIEGIPVNRAIWKVISDL